MINFKLYILFTTNSIFGKNISENSDMENSVITFDKDYVFLLFQPVSNDIRLPFLILSA